MPRGNVPDLMVVFFGAIACIACVEEARCRCGIGQSWGFYNAFVAWPTLGILGALCAGLSLTSLPTVQAFFCVVAGGCYGFMGAIINLFFFGFLTGAPNDSLASFVLTGVNGAFTCGALLGVVTANVSNKTWRQLILAIMNAIVGFAIYRIYVAMEEGENLEWLSCSWSIFCIKGMFVVMPQLIIMLFASREGASPAITQSSAPPSGQSPYQRATWCAKPNVAEQQPAECGTEYPYAVPVEARAHQPIPPESYVEDDLPLGADFWFYDNGSRDSASCVPPDASVHQPFPPEHMEDDLPCEPTHSDQGGTSTSKGQAKRQGAVNRDGSPSKRPSRHQRERKKKFRNQVQQPTPCHSEV